MTSSSVENKVSKVIQEAQEFASIKDSSSFDMQIAEASEGAAQAAINNADAMKATLQTQRDELTQKINNPPMKDKTVSSGCSTSTLEVVDQDKLNEYVATRKGLDTQLSAAQAKAEQAREQATAATVVKIQTKAAEADASSKEQQALAQVSILRTSLAGNEREDIKEAAENMTDKELLGAFNDVVANQANKANNSNSSTGAGNSEEDKSGQKINQTTASTNANTD